MNDPFDMLLRERMTRLLAAVPAEPIERAVLPTATMRGGLSRRRLVLAAGLGLLLAALTISLPAASRPTYEGKLRAIGVPEGAEVVAAGGNRDELYQVLYRQNGGPVRCVGDCEGISLVSPSGKVLFDGGPGPKATPAPRQ